MENYLTDESHVWILPQYHTHSWWELSIADISLVHSSQYCSNEEMTGVMNKTNILVVDSMKYNIPDLYSRRQFEGQFYNPVSVLLG